MTLYDKLVPRHVEERVVKAGGKCDLCGIEQSPGGHWENEDSGWDRSEIEVEARIGAAFPECDTREGYRLDLCPRCFLEKIKPLIERELGVVFHEFTVEALDGYYERLP